jgi:hypothetical protein
MFGTFGNQVRIKSSPETDKMGLTGKVGKVYGETTPSVMDFEIIGSPKRDYALNVYFEDLKESFWFDEELLEQLDNAVGSTITLDGINKQWTKDENGMWNEENIDLKKKWWEFWKK